MKPLNIILVDNNKGFRAALKVFIEQQLNHIVVADVSNVDEFLGLDSIFLRRSDIILMDIIMNQIIDIDATQRINLKYLNFKRIAVTMHDEKKFLDQILKAGFKGCVFKSNIFNNLENALQEVHSGGFFIDEQILIDEKG